MEQEKRIYLRLSAKNELQRRAMQKLEDYDREQYAGITDYIVRAILAYNTPVVIGEEVLRLILREELGNIGIRPETHSEGAQKMEQMKAEELSLVEPEKSMEPKETPEQENAAEEAPELDGTTMDFMKEMGIL